MPDQTTQSAPKPIPEKKEIDYLVEAHRKLKAIKDCSPRELYDKLSQSGYIGQEATRKSLCLMAYRHIRRLKDHYIHKIPLEKLPQKFNVLLTGPTGCGKSYLAELLFGQILKIPVITADMTCYVETGYVGKYVTEILFDLIHTAEGNKHWAKTGVVVLDEIDKIASTGGKASKDITGFGVQRGLLKLIEGGLHEVTGRGPWGNQPLDKVETDCIGFVACGAFSGIENLTVRNNTSSFGFNHAKNKATPDNDEQDISPEVIDVDTFRKYGFLPELIGRFSSIARLSPLGRNDLMEILRKNVLPKYRQEFKREGQKLTVPNKIMESIVNVAIKRKTGARGLTLLLTEYFEQQAFESFGQNIEINKMNPDPPF